MSINQIGLLLAVVFFLTPQAARAARRLFLVDSAATVAASKHRELVPTFGQQPKQEYDGQEALPEELDILDILNMAYDQPFGPGGYGFGHGSYGCYGCYGYYCHHGHGGGYGHGYGDSSRESDADFEELIAVAGSTLEPYYNHRHDSSSHMTRGDMIPSQAYGVYGMSASSLEHRMMQRVWRAEYLVERRLQEELQQWKQLTQRQRGPRPVPSWLEEADGNEDSLWGELLLAGLPASAAASPYGGYGYGYYTPCYPPIYGGYGGGDFVEDLMADPDNLELQQALLEVRGEAAV